MRGWSVGIDVGGTKMLGVLVDPADRVTARTLRPTPRHPGPLPADHRDPALARAVVEALSEVVDGLSPPGPPAGWATGRTSGPDPGGAPGPPIGVGVPGMVDRRGVLRFAPNLGGVAGTPFAAELSVRFPGRVVEVGNDAAGAALAEHRIGAGRGFADVLMVTLGTGIGGGMVAGGQLVGGSQGFSGEVGHMVVDPSGPLCPCGRRGCWERYASGDGLARLAREAAYAGQLSHVVALAGGDPDGVRGEQVTGAAQAGDAGALAVFDQLGWWVALGLSNLVAVLDPAVIILGGGLLGAGELVLGPARRSLGELVEGGAARRPVPLVPAALGVESGAVGAALLAKAASGMRDDPASSSGGTR